MPHDEDLDNFLRLVDALEPFLDQLVFIGGWAHRLHRFRADASIPAHAPLFTEDADVAIPTGTTLSDSLRDHLIAHGFAEEFLGDDQPPVTHYRLGKESSAFYAEFLTPLVGGEGRPGKRRDTEEIGGVVVQKLRHLDVLLIEPWPVTVRKRVVSVPNAVCYIAQKLLIQKKRKPSDRAKDILYIHDTIELFGGSLDELRQLWIGTIRPRLSDRIATELEGLAGKSCEDVTDAIRSAVRQAVAAGRELTPEAVQALCDEGLRKMFGIRRD